MRIVSGSRVTATNGSTRIGYVRDIFVEDGMAWVVVRWEPTMVDSLVDPEILVLAPPKESTET